MLDLAKRIGATRASGHTSWLFGTCTHSPLGSKEGIPSRLFLDNKDNRAIIAGAVDPMMCQ